MIERIYPKKNHHQQHRLSTSSSHSSFFLFVSLSLYLTFFILEGFPWKQPSSKTTSPITLTRTDIYEFFFTNLGHGVWQIDVKWLVGFTQNMWNSKEKKTEKEEWPLCVCRIFFIRFIFDYFFFYFK